MINIRVSLFLKAIALINPYFAAEVLLIGQPDREILNQLGSIAVDEKRNFL
jgi:hypothetical protein